MAILLLGWFPEDILSVGLGTIIPRRNGRQGKGIIQLINSVYLVAAATMMFLTHWRRAASLKSAAQPEPPPPEPTPASRA